MEHGLQHVFVAEHDGCAVFLFACQVLGEPVGDAARLYAVGRGADEGESRVVLQIVKLLAVQLVGESVEVLANEIARLEAAAEVEQVVVPIEERLSAFLQRGHQPLFHFVEHIEAYEGVGGLLGQEVCETRVFHHLAHEGSLVGRHVGGHGLFQIAVELRHSVPKEPERRLDAGQMVRLEFGEEVLQSFSLIVAEEIGLGQLVEVLGVEEQFVGVHQMLVDVLEVGEQDFTPTPEAVDGFFSATFFGQQFLVEAVECGDGGDGVGYRLAGKAHEELVDADVAGRPDGFVGDGRDFLREKQTGALARKDHRHA